MFQVFTVRYPAIAPFNAPTAIMAMYIVGIMGSMPMIVVRYMEATPVIPVTTVRSRINLLVLTHFSQLTLKK